MGNDSSQDDVIRHTNGCRPIAIVGDLAGRTRMTDEEGFRISWRVTDTVADALMEPDWLPDRPARAGRIPTPSSVQKTDAMSTLEETDEGKDVVASNDDKIGIIKAVDHGTAHIDPDPGITDEVKSSLGWGDRDEDTYPLDESDVQTVTDDEVRLNTAR